VSRIEATGLSKRYGTKLAVDNLSFHVEPGVVTGFLGPNGAGKSTTMRLMLRLDHGAGRTLFDGKPYEQLTHPMRHVGAVLEAKAFHPTRTARDHLLMLASANAIPRKRVDEVIEYVGLRDVAKAKPKSFSLGMGQRLGLAVALLGDPHTLILDEPANGLDPQGITWLRNFLKGYASSGRTVFVSSHLLAEMALMADNLVVIGRGKLIATGSVASFIQQASGTTVLVRSPDSGRLADVLGRNGGRVTTDQTGALLVTGLDAAKAGELAFGAGIVLHELTTKVATLEEAFLEATEGSEEFIAQLGGTAALEGVER
jgi:ABC-2 type transport system ATP-binding protein